MRKIETPEKFFDILDRIKGGQWVTIGYVTGANLENYPKVKRKNPASNRTKGYPDHDAFGSPEEISALVKISSYNMRYSSRSSVNTGYANFKKGANDIRQQYGLNPIGDRQSYKDTVNYGGGIEAYNGDNPKLKGHTYAPQNIYGVKPRSIVYCINQEGHIIHELKPEQVKPYLRQYREYNPEAKSYRDDGANALAKMGAEEAQIREYLKKIDSLKFRYINFEADSILWIAASVDGEKIVYINNNLTRAVDGIDINPADFIQIARERYEKDLSQLQEQSNIGADRIKLRLTESEMVEIVEDAVKKVFGRITG